MSGEFHVVLLVVNISYTYLHAQKRKDWDDFYTCTLYMYVHNIQCTCTCNMTQIYEFTYIGFTSWILKVGCILTEPQAKLSIHRTVAGFIHCFVIYLQKNGHTWTAVTCSTCTCTSIYIYICQIPASILMPSILKATPTLLCLHSKRDTTYILIYY